MSAWLQSGNHLNLSLGCTYYHSPADAVRFRPWSIMNEKIIATLINAPGTQARYNTEITSIRRTYKSPGVTADQKEFENAQCGEVTQPESCCRSLRGTITTDK